MGLSYTHPPGSSIAGARGSQAGGREETFAWEALAPAGLGERAAHSVVGYAPQTCQLAKSTRGGTAGRGVSLARAFAHARERAGEWRSFSHAR